MPGRASLIWFCLVFGLLDVGIAEASPRAQRLLLDVWVNGRPLHKIIAVVQGQGQILVTRRSLVRIGVRPPVPDKVKTRRKSRHYSGDELVNLATFKGVGVRIDGPNQRLVITARLSSLMPRRFDLSAAHPPEQDPSLIPAPASGILASGFVLGYDSELTAAGNGHDISGGATFSTAWFTPHAVARSTGFATFGSGRARYVRLDTSLGGEQPGKLRRWSLGDAISGSLDWSRPVRFAGLQIATDFSLQPAMPVMPLPQFFGTATVPSTMDVFVGQSRLMKTSLNPGPFELLNIPVVTGQGQATVTLRDMMGRQITQTVSFFASGRLLRPGLTDFSMEAGVLRKAYGTQSLQYGAGMLQGSLRHGLTRQLTLEAHSEATPGVFLAGGGLNAGFPLGVLGLAVAGSTGNAGSGGLVSMVWQGQMRQASLFVSATLASPGYRDAGSSDGPPPPRHKVQLGGSLSLGLAGSVNMTAVSTEDGYGRPVNLATASYSISLGGGLYLGVSGVYDRTDHQWSAQSFLSLPLGGPAIASASAITNGHSSSVQSSYTRSADPDGGLGYRLTVARGDTNLAEGDIIWVGHQTSLNAAVSNVAGQTAVRAGASGSLVMMDGEMFAARDQGQSFALVKTGAPNIRVFRENRLAAVSNSRGEALVTGLDAYADNHLSIDPRDYPMTTVVTRTDDTVVPPRDGGVVVNFAPPPGHPAIVTVKLANGAFPPLGTPVRVDGLAELLVVGHGGQVFIPNVSGLTAGRLDLADGRCRFDVRTGPDAGANGIAYLGDVRCLRVSDDVR